MVFDWFKRKKPEEKAGEPVKPAPVPASPEKAGTQGDAAPPVVPAPTPVIPAEAGIQGDAGPVDGGDSAQPVPEPAGPELGPGLHRDDGGMDGEGEEREAPLSVSPDPLADAPQRKGWFSRLKEGLAKSTSRLTEGIGGIFTKRKLDDEALEELEELLIQADLGPATAARICAGLAKTRFGKEISPTEVREYLAAEIAKLVEPVARPLVPDKSRKPHIVLVVGVNGTGKTTTIGKLARQFRDEGKTVWMAAGDTFRAAAVAQLKIWGERTGCPVVAKDTGADAAGLAYEAVERARAAGADVLLIDTAGRLQNKQGLMDELRKVVRVIKKLDPEAPHSTILTLDSTTGQNAHSQVEIFREMVGVDGLVLTKLDGSARGGVLVALAEKFKLPVHAIGVGEGAYDLRPFDPKDFARALVGLDD